MIEPTDKRTKEYKDWKASEGLGDTIEKVLNSPLIKPLTNIVKKVIWKDEEDCGCDDKQKKWNKKYSYKFKPKRCFTENEYKDWGLFKKDLTLNFKPKQIKYICSLYSSVMGSQYFEPPKNNNKPLIHMIDKLNIVYDSYELEI